MNSKMVTKIKTKIEESIKTAIHKAAPIVKREVGKTVNKGASNAVDTIFTFIKIGAFIFAITNIGGGKGIQIIAEEAKDAGRNIYNVYNEVHATYHIYLKGDQ